MNLSLSRNELFGYELLLLYLATRNDVMEPSMMAQRAMSPKMTGKGGGVSIKIEDRDGASSGGRD